MGLGLGAQECRHLRRPEGIGSPGAAVIGDVN